jgi:hypothetical protein
LLSSATSMYLCNLSLNSSAAIINYYISNLKVYKIKSCIPSI